VTQQKPQPSNQKLTILIHKQPNIVKDQPVIISSAYLQQMAIISNNNLSNKKSAQPRVPQISVYLIQTAWYSENKWGAVWPGDIATSALAQREASVQKQWTVKSLSCYSAQRILVHKQLNIEQ